MTDGGPSSPAFDVGEFFAGAAVPAVVIDVERRQILAANRAVLELVGHAEHEVLGRPGRDFLDDPSEDEVLRVRLLRGDETRIVRTIKGANGRRVVELHMLPRDDGVVFVQIVDMTEMLAANRLLEESQTELEGKTAALASVAHRMAHDLRSPLVVISGMIDLLHKRFDAVDEDARNMLLERSAANVKSLSAMITDLLEDATRTGGIGSQGSSKVEHLFETIESLVDGQLTEAGATLEMTAEIDTLPVPASTIRQTLLNLVSNSIKYRSPDRPCVITVTVHAEGDELVIDVVDNGMGMGEDPEALFRAGSRGSTTSGVEGTGLGLSFARSVIRELGGAMHALPAEVGSHLQIRLPDRRAARKAEPSVVGGSLSSGLSATDLDRMFEDGPTALIITDLEQRRIVRVNAAAEQLLGVAAPQLLGRPARDFLSDPAEGDSIRGGALAAPGALSMHVTTLRTADGEKPVQIGFHAIEGTTLGAAHVIDLTEAFASRTS